MRYETYDTKWGGELRLVAPTHPGPSAQSLPDFWTASPNSPRENPRLFLRWYINSTPTTQTLSARQASHLLISWQWNIYGEIRTRRWKRKRNETSAKRKTEMSPFVLRTHVTFIFPSIGWSTGLKSLLTSHNWEYKYLTINLIIY